MIHTLKIALLGLFTTATVSAQTNINLTEITKVQIYTNSFGETFKVKTITKERQPHVLDIDERYDLNQTKAYSPVYVDRTVWIDNDNDDIYEKEVILSYTKDMNNQLDYIATANGLFIETSPSSNRLVTEEGTYIVKTVAVNDLTVVVEDVSIAAGQ